MALSPFLRLFVGAQCAFAVHFALLTVGLAVLARRSPRQYYRRARPAYAMAFGTDSVPKVDVISGPGNVYVTLAKQAVYGRVGIDSLAGPSEVLVIADQSANPAMVAADLLAHLLHRSA